MQAPTKTHPDHLLAQDMGRLYADPLGFVMYAYPWDSDPSIQIVELEEPWASRFANCKYGPDPWACQFLDDLGEDIRQRGFTGTKAVNAIRNATSSGHGIGKSALTAWLVDFIMSTRPFCKGVVTANTSPQLSTKTWAEVAKWTKRCITGHWFDVSTGVGNMKMVHKDHPESWRCDAQTCREENSESFAGLHAANSTPFYIFDEASAVPDKIWEVAEGGLTDGEPMIFVFGNPTRNTGAFARCFGSQRHRWRTRQVDSRSVAITNKDTIQQWADDYGEDSDFFRVRVKGEFPRASATQFIATDVVTDARKREPLANPTDPIIIGVDVARFGDDESVIRVRRGKDAKSIPAKKYREIDTMQLAAHVAQAIKEYDPDAVFVDEGGVGGGVVDRLRQLGHRRVVGVNFGASPMDKAYANQRAYMWGAMRDWLKDGGAIEDDAVLGDQLTAVEYAFTPANKVQLERKEDMKRRGLSSPDDADALALTFAQPVGPRRGQILPQAKRQRRYDPHARLKR